MSFLKSGFSFGGPLEHILLRDLWLQAEQPSLPPELGTDAHFMEEALKESLSSVGISNPNPAVGCILVASSGQEIARGATQAYLGPHAERIAFNQVTDLKALSNATAYVTLEPCSHFGNQPPCVDLLISSPIKRVIIARADPNPLVSGQGIQKLIHAGKEVSIGLYEAEATAWNFPFFAYQTLKRPIFILKWAQTLDGQLADDQGTSQWITGSIARSYTHWLRQRYDAILVGAGTLLNDFPKLTVRDCLRPHSRQPLPILFDPKGKLLNIPLEHQQKLSDHLLSCGRNFVYVAQSQFLQKYKSSWIHDKPHGTILSLQNNHLIAELASLIQGPEVTRALGRPLQSVFIEGGAKTLSLFMEAGYADLLHVFIAPLILGGTLNRIQLNQLLKNADRFKLISTSRLGPDTLLEMISPELKESFK